MAIKGLKEQRRLPRLGKIRLGEKALSQKGNPYPRATDYFVCPPEVQAVYGEQPRELDVMFPVEDEDVFLNVWYKCYGSGTGLLCKGDGETATRVDRETGEMVQIDCDPGECPFYADKKCRQLAQVQFLLPHVPGLGVWEIDTSSWNTIKNLYGGVAFIRSITGGRIAGLPLKLKLAPQEVQAEGKKKVVHVLTLTNDQVKLQDLLAASRQTMAEFLLPAPDETEPPDDLYPAEVLETPGRARALKAETVIDTTATTTPPAATAEPEIDPELVTRLNAAWDALGTPKAKRDSTLRSYVMQGKSLEDLLRTLSLELDKRLAGQDNGQSAPPAPRTTAPRRPAPAAPTPPTQARTQARTAVAEEDPLAGVEPVAGLETQRRTQAAAINGNGGGNGSKPAQRAFF